MRDSQRLSVTLPIRLRQPILAAVAAGRSDDVSGYIAALVSADLGLGDIPLIGTVPEPVVVVRLTHRRPDDGPDFGWVPGMVAADYWAAGAQRWRLKEATRRAARVLAIASPDLVAQHVWRIDSWVPDALDAGKWRAVKPASRRPLGPGTGRAADRAVADAILGRSTGPARNPVRVYWPDHLAG